VKNARFNFNEMMKKLMFPDSAGGVSLSTPQTQMTEQKPSVSQAELVRRLEDLAKDCIASTERPAAVVLYTLCAAIEYGLTDPLGDYVGVFAEMMQPKP
jgi:hypothetical protein